MPDEQYEKVDVSINEIEEVGNRLLPLMREADMFENPATAYALLGAAIAFAAASSGTLENFTYAMRELRRFWDDQIKGITSDWNSEERKIVRETATTPRH
jgi:hypothetical protein